MRKAKILVDNLVAGELQELERNKKYLFKYVEGYKGTAVSLTMPVTRPTYEYESFPPFFEGLLPEGLMLEGLLKQAKIDRNDLMAQLIAVGSDLVGNVNVEAIE
ncbi:MAG: toxin HipA [Chlamydiales bacterium]|jgi:serine/threonine-protein kinase HipA|nr:toxin HipA [Chlamydiales bacterium]